VVYTNIGKTVIVIHGMRDARGNPFRLLPGRSVDLSSWPAAAVRAYEATLERYVRNRELGVDLPRPKRAPAPATESPRPRRARPRSFDAASAVEPEDGEA